MFWFWRQKKESSDYNSSFPFMNAAVFRTTGARRNLSFEAAVSNIFSSWTRPSLIIREAWVCSCFWDTPFPLSRPRHFTWRMFKNWLQTGPRVSNLRFCLLSFPDIFDLRPKRAVLFDCSPGEKRVTENNRKRKRACVFTGWLSRSTAVRARISIPQGISYFICFSWSLRGIPPTHFLCVFY